MNKGNKDFEILEKFYCEYFRSPRKREFEAFGGSVERVVELYGTYEKFISHFGYPRVSKGETYEVIENNRRGDVVFIGTIQDISEEFDVFKETVSRAFKENRAFSKKKYKVRLKIM